MRYLLLAYGDEQRLGAMAPDEREALARACRESDEALAASGVLDAAAVLQGAVAVSVRVRHGAVTLAEGPVAPSRERLCAVFTITARDLNEAIRVAAALPQARVGPVEVRPVLDGPRGARGPARLRADTTTSQEEEPTICD